MKFNKEKVIDLLDSTLGKYIGKSAGKGSKGSGGSNYQGGGDQGRGCGQGKGQGRKGAQSVFLKGLIRKDFNWGKGRDRSKRNADISGRIVNTALVAGQTTAEALARRPSVQASINSLKMGITTGMAETHETIDEVYENADEIIAILKSKVCFFERLAVDGVPGSGKSTLARALAELLDFEVKTLDYIDVNSPAPRAQDVKLQLK